MSPLVSQVSRCALSSFRSYIRILNIEVKVLLIRNNGPFRLVTCNLDMDLGPFRKIRITIVPLKLKILKQESRKATVGIFCRSLPKRFKCRINQCSKLEMCIMFVFCMLGIEMFYANRQSLILHSNSITPSATVQAILWSWAFLQNTLCNVFGIFYYIRDVRSMNQSGPCAVQYHR